MQIQSHSSTNFLFHTIVYTLLVGGNPVESVESQDTIVGVWLDGSDENSAVGTPYNHVDLNQADARSHYFSGSRREDPGSIHSP